MFISPRLIFIELHKSGCTHVRKILTAIPSLEGKKVGKHNGISDVKAEILGNLEQKTLMGTIRNPWSWYVSLWAFGCMGEGGLYHRAVDTNLKRVLKEPAMLFKPSSRWKAVYSDPENADHFRQWLQMIFDEKRKFDFGEGFGASPVSKWGGLLTFRYSRLYQKDFDLNHQSATEISELQKLDADNNVVDVMLKNEQLNMDLREVLEDLEIDSTEIDAAFEAASGKTNRSSHKPYQEYYDVSSRDLIAKRDEFIISKYDYSFD